MNFLESLICLVIAAIMAVCGVRVCSDVRASLLSPPSPDPLAEFAPIDILGLSLNIEDLLLQPDLFLG